MVLAGVSVLVFSLIHLVDGDPVRLALGTRFSEEAYDALRERNGLDLPLVQQYFAWAGNALTGDLGVSFRSGEPVTVLILERLPATLTLAFASILVALLIAVPLGLLSALNPRSWIDRIATVLSQIGISVPDFWLAIVLILVFAGTLGWLPTGGYVPLGEDPLDWLYHLILPWTALSLLFIGVYSRVLRSNVLDTLNEDYVRTARAKGLSERRVLVRHVLRNSMIPIVTLWGLDFGAVLGGGAILTEAVFDLQGVGQYVAESVDQLDVPPVLAVTMFGAFFIVLLNTVVDIVYAVLDPRIRLT